MDQEFEDWLEQVISDSLDVDWTPRTAAKAIIRDMKVNSDMEKVYEALGIEFWH